MRINVLWRNPGFTFQTNIFKLTLFFGKWRYSWLTEWLQVVQVVQLQNKPKLSTFHNLTLLISGVHDDMLCLILDKCNMVFYFRADVEDVLFLYTKRYKPKSCCRLVFRENRLFPVSPPNLPYLFGLFYLHWHEPWPLACSKARTIWDVAFEFLLFLWLLHSLTLTWKILQNVWFISICFCCGLIDFK